jgi:hypothetical protein
MATLKQIRTLRAMASALEAYARLWDEPAIADAVGTLLADEIQPAVNVKAEEVRQEIRGEAAQLCHGLGGSDPGNRAAAYAEAEFQKHDL